MNDKTAIYHFTDVSEKRPIVYQKQLKQLQDFAIEKGLNNVELYLDKSLLKSEQMNLQLLLSDCSKYQNLVIKDFYHLDKNTGICMQKLLQLSKNKVHVTTIEDGDFNFMNAPFEKPLKVAIYYCGLEIVGHSSKLQVKIMKSFIREKTNWQIIGTYADVEGNKKDKSQKKLMEMIDNNSNIDVVLVQSFPSFHWRTAKFCKLRNLLGCDIYSMYEDIYLKYDVKEE